MDWHTSKLQVIGGVPKEWVSHMVLSEYSAPDVDLFPQ